MDKLWLGSQLEAGRSIGSIAREVGMDPSTVGYWARKHGLSSSHAERHVARGGIEREVLEALIAQGLSVRGIAEELGLSFTTVRHWLRRHDLQTDRARQPRSSEAREIERPCRTHGATQFVRYGPKDHYRCLKCRKQRVADRRRAVKEILVREAGGRCVLCGYDRLPRALHFHHLDPGTKAFGLAFAGVARSIDRSREEVAKCVLLCGNCHMEVEAGVANILAPTRGAGAG